MSDNLCICCGGNHLSLTVKYDFTGIRKDENGNILNKIESTGKKYVCPLTPLAQIIRDEVGNAIGGGKIQIEETDKPISIMKAWVKTYVDEYLKSPRKSPGFAKQVNALGYFKKRGRVKSVP